MPETTISEVTRRAIFDELSVMDIDCAGRLSDTDFLSRIFNLNDLPSHDSRYKTMAGDVGMHRDHFRDWSNDWMFTDQRLDLLWGTDERFVSFLCEMLHPVVRSDAEQVDDLAAIFNRHLARDGYEIAPHTYISGRPVFRGTVISAGGRIVTSASSQAVADELSSTHIRAQLIRINGALTSDPGLAIGSAKEFVESICKHVLRARGETLTGKETFQDLVRMARDVLGIKVRDGDGEILRKTLHGLSTIVQGVAELRGKFGTGHGQHPDVDTPSPVIAKLAVGAAETLGVFLFEVHTKGIDGKTLGFRA